MTAHGDGTAVPTRPLDGLAARILARAEVGVIVQDASLTIRSVHNLPAAWGSGAAPGMDDSALFSGPEAPSLRRIRARVLEDSAPAEAEIRLSEAGADRWYSLRMEPLPPPDRGVMTVVVDITEQRRREQTIRALLREVSHRSKNLLAVIQSVATQTGRYSDTIDTFMSRFRGRLQSLAYSQDLVTSANWSGVKLADLLRSQISRYVPQLDRVTLHGANPVLNPNAALHIGLALHELAVNSTTYGALSHGGGTARIDARVRKTETGDRTLILIWTEDIAESPEGFSRRRFGSVALERVVPASLDGSAMLKTGPFGLEYRLEVPERSVVASS